MTKAIVTAIIGDAHQQLWTRHARPTWEQYAKKHGYELITLEQPIDASPRSGERSLAWQKLLVLGLPQVQQFDRVVWLDSDILINVETAPCIVDGVPPELIGAVQDQFLLSQPLLARPFGWLNQSADEPTKVMRRFYERNNLSPGFDYLINTGVLVLSPRHHREVLEETYRNHHQTPHSFFEEVGLSHEVLRRGLHHPLNPRFNCLWVEFKFAFYPFLRAAPALMPLCVGTAFTHSFFLHFAAVGEEIAYCDPDISITRSNMSIPLDLIERIQIAWTKLTEAAKMRAAKGDAGKGDAGNQTATR